MNIKKRFIISNTIIVVVPIVITVIIMSSLFFIYSNITGDSIEYDEIKRRMYIQSQLVTISNNILKQSDETMKNCEFENDLSQQLSRINGDFVIIKSNKIIYKPEYVNKIDIEKCIEMSKENNINNNIIINNSSYVFKTIELNLKDKSTGVIILLAPIKEEINLFNKFIIITIFVFIIIFIITNIVMSYILSKSIIKPIKVLKKATSEIRNGNLNCTIAEEGDEEVKELCRDFEAMRVQLKDSTMVKMKYDDNRKGLISSISHDLRTPITSIKGYVEGILDGVANTPEKKERYLRTIYSKAEHVDHMIDDLLLYSKLDLKQIPFNFEKVDIVEYFNYCVSEIEPELIKDNIKINLNNELNTDKFVMMDRERMRRVVLNIIGNSRKYMDKPQGKIVINLRETNFSIIIDIRDNGPGIDNDDINKIFHRFYRTDAARSGAKGSGLGLVIAKEIVEGHNGRIWAINHSNKGTSIVISLGKIKNLNFN
ncbi:sensor histidine kinase YycG [Clostridium acetireducens DSM 10703]|uniref:histidine kinase n=1 Tax=Clostridium acetireducens DSM 10703 TaxID=1121290 RepID=A0A1E8F0Z0_9CLOT|nr:HAMP domain-containing sensor histidine kinase [Clostridium acetireducens]OFI07082.1 sensor histidine kinase YycG [Clostridium acetireducens DSM 10703]